MIQWDFYHFVLRPVLNRVLICLMIFMISFEIEPTNWCRATDWLDDSTAILQHAAAFRAVWLCRTPTVTKIEESILLRHAGNSPPFPGALDFPPSIVCMRSGSGCRSEAHLMDLLAMPSAAGAALRLHCSALWSRVAHWLLAVLSDRPVTQHYGNRRRCPLWSTYAACLCARSCALRCNSVFKNRQTFVVTVGERMLLSHCLLQMWLVSLLWYFYSL